MLNNPLPNNPQSNKPEPSKPQHRCAAVLLLGALLLGGCASSGHQFPMAEFAPVDEPVYPPIDVFQLKPDAEFRNACTEFRKGAALKHCDINLLDYELLTASFANTGYFESVELASRNQPYSINVLTATYDAETAGELGNAALSGATLMLIPMTNNAILKVKGDVRWHSELVHRFEFDLPYTLKGGWGTLGNDPLDAMADSVVSHIVSDLQSTNIFSIAHLHQVLQSSDYAADLRLPKSVGRFQRAELSVLRHPLHGAGTRYEHSDYANGHADVFVYPVRQWQYEQQEHVTTEVDSVRKDLQLYEQEGYYQELKLGPNTSSSLNGEQDRLLGSFSGEYAKTDGTPMSTQTHIFSTGDKFVKVRATFGAFTPALNEVDTFVRELAKLIEVPEESLFMARLRKQWRDDASP